MIKKCWKSLERFWDNGMWSGSGRKFSLLISGVWIYTLLIWGFWNKSAHYFAIPFGILLLCLDDHNINSQTETSKSEVNK